MNTNNQYQYAFDYSGYNGIKFNDQSLEVYEGDWRSGGAIISRTISPIRQHELDREVYEKTIKYLNGCENYDTIVERLNRCEWVKHMNDADEKELIGTAYIIETRVKKSWDNISYSFDYVGSNAEEAEENRFMYGNISGKGNYLRGTGTIHEVVKYKVGGRYFYYTRTWSECTDPCQKPVQCNEKLHMITNEDELLRIAMMYL